MNLNRTDVLGRIAVACTTLVAVAIGAGQPASAADADKAADNGTTAAAVRAYRAAYPQMSPQAARAAFDGQLARKQVYDAIAKDTNTFGGAWFDPPTGVFHAAVTTAEAQATAVAKGRERAVKVQTHLVERSYASLDKLAADLRNEQNTLGKASGGQIGIDVKTNQVVVALGAQAQAGVAAAEVPAGVTLINDPNIKTVADAGCTSRLECDWTIRAGAVLRFNGSPACSVGFTARGYGARWVYTAGHCNLGGGTWSVSGDPVYGPVGPMVSSVLTGPYDVGLIQVTNPWFGADLGGEIYIENAGHSVALNYAAPTMSYLLAGETVCLSANFTQPNGSNFCGVIGTTSDPAVLGMVRVDGLDACPGDSGGGWYWLGSSTYRVAYGIHSRSDGGCHGDLGGSRSWFSPVPIVTPLWGLAIETR